MPLFPPTHQPNWLYTHDPAAPGLAAGRRWLWLALAVWAAAMWFVLQPHEVGMSWRECDTMAIARNFLVDGFDPLRPRVDWRGDTDGAVECEFPLYQMLIAATLAVFGEVEWPARLLSLLAIGWAALALHRLLEWRTGAGGALAGALVFLGGAQAVLLGARVQPDGLSTALALAGTATFLHYLRWGRGTALWLAAAATALGVLQKPTALQIVAVQGLWAVFLAPHRLREGRLWLALLLVLAPLAAWLWHGVQLHAETGLTFGVLGGGETKFPALGHLRKLWVWDSLLRTTAAIGLSPFGVAAGLWLLLRRRLDRCDLALFGAAAAGLIGSLRYSHTGGTGPQYHVFAAVAGAYAVARIWPARAPRAAWWLLLGAVAFAFTHWLGRELQKLDDATRAPALQLAAQLRATTDPADLLVLRSPREAWDPHWRRRTNHEEPTLLYQARRRGWVLPRDGFDAASLGELRQRGARLVVDLQPQLATPELRQWLAANADAVPSPVGAVWRLRGSAAAPTPAAAGGG